MKLSPIKNVLLLLLFPFVSANAQIEALFNNNTQLKDMTERWELDTTAVRETFLLTPFKPVYIIPGIWTSNVNKRTPKANSNIESKFQLSFKTKVLQNFFWGHGDLWVAYTQVAHWQIYNTKLSRPFREVNHEPELILNFPVKFKLFGFNTRMIGMALNHQSNGKSEPYSRSWNRVIFHAGFERNNWTVYVRPWFRMPDAIDDNPNIAEYIGRGDVNLIYTKNGNILSFIGTHHLNFNSKTKGGASFSWSYPIKNNLKGFLQVSHGYGASLIDYNHSQTTVGVGVSLIEWL